MQVLAAMTCLAVDLRIACTRVDFLQNVTPAQSGHCFSLIDTAGTRDEARKLTRTRACRERAPRAAGARARARG